MTRITTPGTPAYAYPGVAYPASKAAVNMITVQYAKAFPDMRILNGLLAPEPPRA